MIYRSNLPAPDCFRDFKHVISRPMPHSFGHDVPSDWHDKSHDDPVFGIWKRCGSWTHDESAILAACAKQFLGRTWIDIGCNTGSTSKVINWATNAPVCCVDYMLGLPEFRERFADNTGFPSSWTQAMKSDEFFTSLSGNAFFSGIVIDGDHDDPQPLKDAANAWGNLAEDGVIILHDGTGRPVRAAVEALLVLGMKVRPYFTPHLVFVCWRGNFTPPQHVPDEKVKAALLDGRLSDFDFTRCE